MSAPSKKSWAAQVVLLALSGVMLAPLAYLFSTALSAPESAVAIGASPAELLLPRDWRWENFAEVWRIIPFLRHYVNSLLVAGVVTGGQVLTSACAAYAFARLDWPGRDKLFMGYLATLMVPHSVTMLPNFVLMQSLPGWLAQLAPWIDWEGLRYVGSGSEAIPVGRLIGLDSYFALMAPGMFSAYGTFMLRQFFLTLPRSVDEAAKIDGCGYARLFWQILLPMAMPALATLTVLMFVSTWSAFLWPLIVTNQEALRTLPLALPAFQGEYGTQWHLLMAAALLMMLPSIIVFLLGQKYFVAGLTAGASKE